MEKNEISVVMSVYNTKIFLLNKTIKSILDQTYKNFEFLIVNDGSNKEIDHELKRWLKKDKRIKVMSNEINIGLTKSLNKALKCAKGRYVARIDAGDTCRNDRLKIQKDFLDKHKDFALIGSYMKMVNEGGDIIGQITYPVRFNKIK